MELAIYITLTIYFISVVTGFIASIIADSVYKWDDNLRYKRTSKFDSNLPDSIPIITFTPVVNTLFSIWMFGICIFFFLLWLYGITLQGIANVLSVIRKFINEKMYRWWVIDKWRKFFIRCGQNIKELAMLYYDVFKVTLKY